MNKLKLNRFTTAVLLAADVLISLSKCEVETASRTFAEVSTNTDVTLSSDSNKTVQNLMECAFACNQKCECGYFTLCRRNDTTTDAGSLLCRLFYGDSWNKKYFKHNIPSCFLYEESYFCGKTF